MLEKYYKAAEKYDRKMAKKKAKMRKKASKILAKDFGGSAAGYTFYINHDYDHPYTQAEWIKLHDKLLIADNPEAIAPMYNAIVVEYGYYIRRGLEKLNHSGEYFSPGKNDRVSDEYAIEPYTYRK